MSVFIMLKKIITRYKDAHTYLKRGIIYIIISASFILYELTRPTPRTTVILLWGGVIVLAIIIMTTLKDPRH